MSIEAEVSSFIVESFLFGDAEGLPGVHESLLESGVIDSTGVLELIEFLETRFDIRVEDSETIPQNLDSIENLVTFVNGKLQE